MVMRSMGIYKEEGGDALEGFAGNVSMPLLLMRLCAEKGDAQRPRA